VTSFSGVSVVIPCYNALPHVVDAIQSVEAQSTAVDKIIVVDDGSTDDTWVTLKNLYPLDSEKVQLVRSENRGACHARNLGLSLVNSEYVAYLDADDYWASDKITLQLEQLSENPNLIAVTTDFHFVREDGIVIPGVSTFDWTKESMVSWTLLGRQAPALNSTLLTRRTTMLEVGGYNEDLVSFAEDLDLAWRLFQHGDIKSVNSNSVSIRFWPGQGHRNLDGMQKSLSKVYGYVAVWEPELADLAKKQLDFYFKLRAAVSGRPGLLKIAKVAWVTLRSPAPAIVFFSRRLNGVWLRLTGPVRLQRS